MAKTPIQVIHKYEDGQTIEYVGNKVEVKPDNAGNVKFSRSEAGLKGETALFTTAPLSGAGTVASPLRMGFSDDFTVINGQIHLADKAPETMTNIKTSVYNLGFHTFAGGSDSTTGLPIDINSNEIEQGMATGPTTANHYDYNGYYIASADQLDVWLVGVEGTAWKITNERGVNENGTLKNPNGWGLWQKLDNTTSVTNAMVTGMQNQINGLSGSVASLTAANTALAARLKAIEDDIITLWDASGTVKLGRILRAK